MRPDKPTLKDIANGPPLLCPICERPNYHPSDHHMVPRSRGGKSTETICADCHKAIHAHFAKQVKFLSKQDPAGRTKTKKNKDRLRRDR